MRGKPHIVLIGPMGSGKTAVGKQLAKQLRMRFVDSDVEIERSTGVDIPFIFEREGEAGFREREREIIDRLSAAESPIVLATGGGAVLREENRRVLAERGFVVYLETSVAQQVERVRHSQHRPLLRGVDPTERLTQLMQVRAPLYAEIADLAVRTDGRKVHHVVADILHALRPRET